MKSLLTYIFLFSTLTSINSYAEKLTLWTLSSNESKVAYGSIKKNSVGEVNHFKNTSGSINSNGEVKIDIDVTSVETFIDIRNQRMLKHIFDKNAPTAQLKTAIDRAEISKLLPGQTTSLDVTGTLTLSGQSVEIETSIFIARLNKNRLLATSDEIIMVKTEELGVNDGVDQLMELAKLNSITRVVPVTLRLVFDKSQATAAAVKSQTTIAVAGNAKAGKKLYRQCKACHQSKKEVNSVGPHLVNIIGRPAGTIDGFAYSDAIKNSGIIWTVSSLQSFLENPQAAVPGNSMPFGGISNTEDIQNLIAYLESISK